MSSALSLPRKWAIASTPDLLPYCFSHVWLGKFRIFSECLGGRDFSTYSPLCPFLRFLVKISWRENLLTTMWQSYEPVLSQAGLHWCLSSNFDWYRNPRMNLPLAWLEAGTLISRSVWNSSECRQSVSDGHAEEPWRNASLKVHTSWLIDRTTDAYEGYLNITFL